MSKRMLSLLVMILMGVMLWPGVAGAQEPTGGCQRGFQLMTIEEVLAAPAHPDHEGFIRAMDANGDNHLCFKLLPDAVPLFDPTFIYYDNNKPRVLLRP